MFYGKQFKISSSTNLADVLEKLGITDESLRLINSDSAVNILDKHDDGSYQFINILDNKVLVNNTWFPNQDFDFVTPSGTTLKINFAVEDNVMKYSIKLPNGRYVCVDGYFIDNNQLKSEFYIPGVDVIGVVHHKTVN